MPYISGAQHTSNLFITLITKNYAFGIRFFFFFLSSVCLFTYVFSLSISLSILPSIQFLTYPFYNKNRLLIEIKTFRDRDIEAYLTRRSMGVSTTKGKEGSGTTDKRASRTSWKLFTPADLCADRGARRLDSLPHLISFAL